MSWRLKALSRVPEAVLSGVTIGLIGFYVALAVLIFTPIILCLPFPKAWYLQEILFRKARDIASRGI